MSDNEIVGNVIEKMNLRAERARRFANVSIVVIIVVVLSMIAFFYVTPTVISISGAVESQISINTSWLSELSPTLAKLTAIVLAVYLIQILVGFTRYQYKVADHLYAAAFALELSSGDMETFNKAMISLSLSHIEFGKMPATLSDKGLDVIKEAMSKIPVK